MQLSPAVARRAARRSPHVALFLSLSAVLLATLLLAPGASAKVALQGGISSRSGLEAEIPESTEEAPAAEAEVPAGETTVPGAKARIVDGRAVAPASAPAAVKQVIAAANRISATPYIWGGGHRTWVDRGYDCSGAVSFALHGGRLLASPLTSGSLESFGEAGAGRWISIYANAAHTYMVVAGLRFDTAGDESGTGPRWHSTVAAAASGTFVVRHPTGY